MKKYFTIEKLFPFLLEEVVLTKYEQMINFIIPWQTFYLTAYLNLCGWLCTFHIEENKWLKKLEKTAISYNE